MPPLARMVKPPPLLPPALPETVLLTSVVVAVPPLPLLKNAPPESWLVLPDG